MSRKYYPPEFKVEAASKVLDEGLSISEACRSFDVGTTAMRRWVKQLQTERGGGVLQQTQPISVEQRRIRELEARVRELEEEKEILKKATAFFVQEQAGKRRFKR